MASTENGIHAWMASVRASMANDPCRQLFEDQVQTHAFIFLEDYLEHILAGPKQAPIIELVKTPGRKKNAPHRTRAATAAAAKAREPTSLSLDSNDSARDTAPVNSFHKALLQAREKSSQDALDAPKASLEPLMILNDSVDDTHGRTTPARVVGISEITVSIEPETLATTMPLQQHPRNAPNKSSTQFAVLERGIELSVIAEGDESPERSHANMHSLPTALSKQDKLSGVVPSDCNQLERHTITKRNSEIIATNNTSSEDSAPDWRNSNAFRADAHHSIPRSPTPEVQFPGIDRGHHTEPLPSRTASSSLKDAERDAFTAPLPIVPVSNPIQIPNTVSVPLNDSPPRSLTQKSNTTGFPMLPAPSPLRKSVRVPQEIPSGVALPTPAPAPAPLGKRTSWLMKAREAKAKGGVNSLPGTTAGATSTSFPHVSTAVKRKSDEMHSALPPRTDGDKNRRKSKVAKSTEFSVVPSNPKETGKGSRPSYPLVHSEPVAPVSIVAALPVDHSEPHTMDIDEQTTHLDSAEGGFIDLFKRTVEGFGARTGKSMGKSLGGAAAAALAEARAAAEAKVAERNKAGRESNDSEVLHDEGLPEEQSLGTQPHSDDHTSQVNIRGEGVERRLSISDLVSDTVQPIDLEYSMEATWSRGVGTQDNRRNESIPTTPPNSPPSKGSSAFVKPAGPVFNKPLMPPVFVPPASKESSSNPVYPKESSLNFPPGQFRLPVVSLGIPARLPSPADGLLSLVQGKSQTTAQPSQSSPPSGLAFGNHAGIPTWSASVQDTFKLQSPDTQFTAADDDGDDDDSWPLEEKLAAVEPGWQPFDFSNADKEDTWSSLPTESQGPTRSLPTGRRDDVVEAETNDERAEQEQEIVEISDTGDSIMEVDELEEAAECGMASLRLVEPPVRSMSQASTASSAQSQAGFFNQATKLVNSMLGGGKKAKPELKSLQLAAAAAKKQQEEAGKKTQRLKDMEARRQVALAKKADEERTRLLEEERRSKEDFEKRKREREENTDRRPLKLPLSTKAEDDALKKRRLAPEAKKSETKKPPSKVKGDLAYQAKGAITPATKLAAQKGAKVTATALLSSTAYNTTQNAPPHPSAKPNAPEAKPFRIAPPSSLKGKTKAKPLDDDMGDKLPSTMVQSQMAARAKAQMQAAKLPTPEVPSESIELPEINSEYSDSGDENRVRTFDPPEWAQSPELRQALQMQSTVNPDDIFGAIRPLRMEEMFRTRQSRFRARTSSANWSGSDRLTIEEIREYERRMGFQQTRAS